MYNPEVAKETIVSCAKARQLPQSPTPQRVYRWRTYGIWDRPRDQRVTLEWCLIGRDPVTSLEAFQRFIGRLGGRLPQNGRPKDARRKRPAD